MTTDQAMEMSLQELIKQKEQLQIRLSSVEDSIGLLQGIQRLVESNGQPVAVAFKSKSDAIRHVIMEFEGRPFTSNELLVKVRQYDGSIKTGNVSNLLTVLKEQGNIKIVAERNRETGAPGQYIEVKKGRK